MRAIQLVSNPSGVSWKALLVAAVSQAALGHVGLLLANMEGNISPFWPATGLGIWLLVTRGRGMLPAIMAGQIAMNLSSDLPLLVSIGIGAGGAAEATLGYLLWSLVTNRWGTRLGVHQSTAGILAVSLLAPVAGATAGVTTLLSGGIISSKAIVAAWSTWWIGNFFGILFVFPLLLAAPRWGRWLHDSSRQERAQAALVLALSAALCGLAFFSPGTEITVLGVFFLLPLAARWSHASSPPLVAGLIAAAVLLGSQSGTGPFVTGNLDQDLLHMQWFLVSVAIMAQLLPTFRGRGSIMPCIILAVGWTLSGGILAIMRQTQAHTTAGNFGALTTDAAAAIQARLGFYLDAMRSAGSHLLAHPIGDQKSWATYVQSLQVAQQDRAIRGLGVVTPAPWEAFGRFEEYTLAVGNFTIPINSAGGFTESGPRERFVITRAAATADDFPGLGFDLSTLPESRLAAEQARDTGEPRMSAQITLTQEGVARPGFLLFLPVYRPDFPLKTVDDRRAALEAWIYTPLATEQFIQTALEPYRGRVGIHFFDADAPMPERLVYASEPAGARAPKFRHVSSLRLPGRSFTLGWSPGPLYQRTNTPAALWATLGVQIGSLLLAALVQSLQNVRKRAEELTANRTLELRKEMARRELADTSLKVISSFQSAILNSASTAIISTTTDGTIRTFNPAAARLLGYAESEIVDRQTPFLFHDPAEMVARAAEFSAELGITVEPGFAVLVVKAERNLPNEHEWTYVRKDGSRVPVVLSVTAIRNAEGELFGYIGTAADISERQRHLRQLTFAKQATEAALREVELQRHAVDQHAIVSVTDARGRIQYVNSKFCEISGFTADELIGRTHRLIKSDRHPEDFWRHFWQTIQNGRIWTGEICNHSKQGVAYWVASTVVPVRTADGKVERFFAIRTDISARKEYEAELVAARTAAEAASKSKSEFLAVMSHEIRTPMNAVIGFTELLLDTRMEPDQRNFLEIIRTSGQNLIAVINDILNFSKIEAGKLEVDHIRFDGLGVIESVAKTLALQAKSKGLWLRLVCAPEVPRIIIADPSRLHQVLINLVGNAVKFTTHGGVLINVTNNTTANGMPALRVSIIDTGIGISAEKQTSLFQKFTQADSSVTREFGGTGLGLAICKNLVELMGGTIGLTSNPGSGSTFWCDFPLSADQSPLMTPATLAVPAAEIAAPPSREALGAAAAGHRVLVADDNRLNQMLVQSFLAKLGCTAVCANNGVEALNLVQTQTFDVVLMDHQMPLMDGCGAAKAIRKWEQEQEQGSTKRVPIIALTANASATGEALYRAAGMDSYLTKPVLLPELKRAIEKVAPLSPTADAPPVSSPAPLMDHPRALARVENDRTLLGLLAAAFPAQCDELLCSIRNALKARDATGLRQHAHTLKGAIAYFAADKVSALTVALENAAESPNWEQLDAMGAELESHLQQLRAELAALPASSPLVPA